MTAANPPALFILSFKHRDALTRVAERFGWRPVATRRLANADARFIASGASIAVIDARGALAQGLEGAAALGDLAEANAAAMLVLLSKADSGGLDGFYTAGATHFLVAPFGEDQLLEAVRFAHRHAERVAGGHRRRADDSEAEGDEHIRRTAIPAAPGSPLDSRDAMTGLFDAHAGRAWIEAHLEDRQAPIMLLLLAVSRFDAINAAFGRKTGDQVLQEIARRIERLIDAAGQPARVARFAGAEFAVMLAAPADVEQSCAIALKLVEAIGRPFMSGDHVVVLASRIGIVQSGADDDSASLLRHASAALVEAKRAENGPIHVFQNETGRGRARGDQLEIDLRRALDQDEIEILFQPQVSIATGKIVGAEALARWRHPELGELGAATLFDVAERSDYTVQLSDHVQRKAIRAAAAWPAALKPLRLAVNITANDIARPDFATLFLARVAEEGFDPARLTIEVTESGLIEDLGRAAALLAQLREGGLRIAIDDFGTGYSSLAYLKALPLDYLKIDKRLAGDIGGSVRDRIVVRSVIDMARSLGLEVIAEGVETEEQLGLLAQEGCNLYQGFLCSPPIDAEALASLL